MAVRASSRRLVSRSPSCATPPERGAGLGELYLERVEAGLQLPALGSASTSSASAPRAVAAHQRAPVPAATPPPPPVDLDQPRDRRLAARAGCWLPAASACRRSRSSCARPASSREPGQRRPGVSATRRVRSRRSQAYARPRPEPVRAAAHLSAASRHRVGARGYPVCAWPSSGPRPRALCAAALIPDCRRSRSALSAEAERSLSSRPRRVRSRSSLRPARRSAREVHERGRDPPEPGGRRQHHGADTEHRDEDGRRGHRSWRHWISAPVGRDLLAGSVMPVRPPPYRRAQETRTLVTPCRLS